MSESLSQREIEDVLSSIRRLVSQEVARSNAERLLLTPALRVVGDEASAAAPGAAAPGAAGGAGSEAIEWQDPSPSAPSSAATPPVATPQRGGSAQDPAAPLSPDSDRVGADDLVLDEAALREIVGQCVREELRGALGERLTRSIRKLVRTEVSRALSEREFL